jgi:hypothetical protein
MYPVSLSFLEYYIFNFHFAKYQIVFWRLLIKILLLLLLTKKSGNLINFDKCTMWKSNKQNNLRERDSLFFILNKILSVKHVKQYSWKILK